MSVLVTPRSSSNGARQTGEPAPRARVLLVDDEPALRRSAARLIMTRGFAVDTAEDGAAALDLLKTRPVDVLLLDLAMPRMSGMEVLAKVKEQHPEVAVVVMTPFGEVEPAVAAVQAGAYDFVVKPFASADEVSLSLEKAADHQRLASRTKSLERRLEQHERFGEIVGSSTRMVDVYRTALGVAPTSSTVLILGENGTGKELLARALHRHSTRADRPLGVVNCGAIPAHLIEAELFGGDADKPGIFELFDKGTVLLDEIGDLPPPAQLRLTQALSEGALRRAGAAEARPLDVRILAAGNIDLKERVSAGRFREDLYYRLSVVPLLLPPLRKRREDIPLLAYHFLQKYARRAGRDLRRISVEALRQLREYAWPGNVRELENAIEHAVVMARGDVITPGDLPIGRRDDDDEGESKVLFGTDLGDTPYAEAKERAVDAFDKAYVERLMKRTSGNVSEAARQAGMDRSNFRRLLKKVRAKEQVDE